MHLNASNDLHDQRFTLENGETREYGCEMLVYWALTSQTSDMVTINIPDIIVKLAYNKREVFHIFRFPDVIESIWSNTLFFVHMQINDNIVAIDRVYV